MAEQRDPIITITERLEALRKPDPKRWADWTNAAKAEDRYQSRVALLLQAQMVAAMDAGVEVNGWLPVLPADVAAEIDRRYRRFLVEEVENRQPRRHYGPRLPQARSW